MMETEPVPSTSPFKAASATPSVLVVGGGRENELV